LEYPRFYGSPLENLFMVRVEMHLMTDGLYGEILSAVPCLRRVTFLKSKFDFSDKNVYEVGT